VCFSRADGTVGSLVTIELGQWVEEEEADDEENIQRVILLNIYHMSTFFKVDEGSLNLLGS
jgi:hypothetical protein